MVLLSLCAENTLYPSLESILNFLIQKIRMSEPLWQPSPERVQSSLMTQLQRKIEAATGLRFESYSQLHQWSVSHPEAFWRMVWEDAEVLAWQSSSKVMVGHSMPGTNWFEGARLNLAENLLGKGDPDQTALLFADEQGRRQSLTFSELRQKVTACQQALKELGVSSGDRVAAIMPNCCETVVAALAAQSLGAVWSSCSPDFGISGIHDRLGQIQPRVLIATNAYSYNGKVFDCLPKVQGILERINSIQTAVIVEFCGQASTLSPRCVKWHDWLQPTQEAPTFAALPFDHPAYILYSSGTTGVPKSIVHGAGGTLIQHLKEHRYHCDLKPGDKLFFFTTCGWMMWNWLVSGLASGATVVLYDGSPAFPDVARLWDLVQREGVTHFGTSPKFLTSVLKADYSPKAHHDFEALRVVMSTGAPLSGELFDWVYNQVKADVQLASISGGTDIISCFVLGNPNLPVYRGEIQCKGLGMDVYAYDEQGQPVQGTKGDLVCATPFPSMPIQFWNDPDQAKYRAAYFDQFPGKWTHGDYIEFTERGGAIIHGRSDTTLNPGGIRIGTAEIYRLVEGMEEVVDSVVVGRPLDDDVQVELYVVLRQGQELDEALSKKIQATIRQGATPRHVPHVVRAVPEIPRTISGKKVEKAVLQVLIGQAVPNTSALLNPLALEAFKLYENTKSE